MKFQPTKAQKGNDDVQTPPELASLIVHHFKPSGAVLEPCCGTDRNFEMALRERIDAQVFAADIKDVRGMEPWPANKNFLGCPPPLRFSGEPWDWIVTNPPWSKIRPFLAQAMKLADNVVFLITVNHVFTRARVRDAAAAGFALKEILLVDTPKKESGWPQMGFQLGAVHWQRGYSGPVTIGRGQ